MISSALILPTETPLSLSDIKRSLITFDKAFIASPDDREFIPPNVYQNELFGYFNLPRIPIFGMSSTPVRPLGKITNYDDDTQRVIDQCRDAIQENKIEILATPQYTSEITLGAPVLPDDTPNSAFTYSNYRKLAENPEFVNAMAVGLEKLDFTKIDDITRIAPPGREDDEQTVNGVLQIPKAKISLFPGLPPAEVDVLSKIVHARIGTTVKFLAYCHNKNLTPFTTDKGISNFISKLEYKVIGRINEISAENEAIITQKRLNALENLVFEELIDHEKLNALSVKDVLTLRSKAWGKVYEGKNDLIRFINVIAKETGDNHQEFLRASRRKIEEYEKQTSDYRNELERLKLSLTLKAGLGATGYIMSDGTTLFDTVLKSPTIEFLIALAAPAALAFTKELVDQIVDYLDLMDKRRESHQQPAYAVYNHYRYLIN